MPLDQNLNTGEKEVQNVLYVDKNPTDLTSKLNATVNVNHREIDKALDSLLSKAEKATVH